MSGAPPDWDLIRSFLAVLRQGSLSGAARALRLTQPTIGRHIEQLEASVGATLFLRSPSGLLPTDACAALRGYAEAMESAAEALARAASGSAEQVAGTVRITASEVVGAEVLPPILAALRERHPALVVELVLSNRTEDLLRQEADIAVRMTEPRQDALVVRPLGEVELGLHARAEYLERRGTPQTLDEARRLTLIGPDRAVISASSLKGVTIPITRDLFAFRTDSDLAQLAAIRAGLGIGVCQVPLARRDPALVRVLPHAFAARLPVYLVTHEALRGSGRVRATLDALSQGLAAYLG